MAEAVIEVRVEPDDFTVQAEYDALCAQNADDGALVFFVGRVRDLNDRRAVSRMHLEHYPGMAEAELGRLAEQASERWPLNRIRIVHRVGDLEPADQIMFVGVTSPHRQAAFTGAQFLMDYLKTRAPFWKKETAPDGTAQWLDAPVIPEPPPQAGTAR